LSIVLFGKYLEPIWGSREFLFFILLINTLAGIGAIISILIIYAVKNFDSNILLIPIGGFCGVIGGFSVALKQLIPEQELSLIMILPIRVKHLPVLTILWFVVASLLGGGSYNFLLTIGGSFSAWIYLRFYQRKGEVIGDMNPSFAFATFFPEILQPIINIFSNITYKIFCMNRTRAVTQTTQITTSTSTDSLDVERRKQRGTLSIDSRIAEIKHNTTESV